MTKIENIHNSYQLGQMVAFDGTKMDAHRYFQSGISDTEANYYAWTNGAEARIRMCIEEEILCDLSMEINLVGIFAPPQQMIVQCGGTVLFDEIVEDGDSSIHIDIPAEYVVDHSLELMLLFPGAISPLDLGQSEDPRMLAFAITSFSLDAAS